MCCPVDISYFVWHLQQHRPRYDSSRLSQIYPLWKKLRLTEAIILNKLKMYSNLPWQNCFLGMKYDIIIYIKSNYYWKQPYNLCLRKFKLSDLKRKIRTWTGIQTSDLRITSPALSLELCWFSWQLTLKSPSSIRRSEVRIPVHVRIFLLRFDNYL